MDKHTISRMSSPTAPWIWRYGLAVLLVVFSTLLRWLLPGVLTGTPYLAFFPAVAVAASVGGFGPGLLATLLCIGVVDLLYDASYLEMGFENPVWDARQAIFLVGGLGVSLLARMLEKARARERLQAVEIAQQRNKYRIVADNTYDWEFWLSPDGQFLYNSPSCVNVSGYDAEAFSTDPTLVLRIVHPDDRSAYEQHRGATGHACSTSDIEYRIIRRDGEVRWIHHTCVPVFDDEGRYLGIRGTNRDITDRKNAEMALAAAVRSADRAKATAEEANQAKDRFLAMLSHELRTPLAPVLAAVSMLQRQSQSDVALLRVLEMIRRNVEMEARLIDDLLDVTRISRGKIELDKHPVELRSVIDRAVEVCRPDIESKRLRFSVSFCADGSCVVEADAGRLQQVFWNLIKNAIKFTPEEGHVSIQCERDGHDGVMVEVKDDGMGIAPEAMGRIFSAFAQGDEAVTRQYGGLGLGLSISKSLVELHGGTLEAYSAGKGQGATFRLRLPLVAEAMSMGEPLLRGKGSGLRHDAGRDEDGHQEGKAERLRLLVVEDHVDSADMLRLMLESEGHEVDVAGSIAAAGEKLVQNSFDLLICDLGLPDGSGLDLIREMRARGQALPAIALSGYGQEQDVQQSREAGFAAHLTKPVDMDRLLTALDKVAGAANPANR